MALEKLNDMLDKYNDRDKILRLLGYTSQLVSGLTNNDRLSKFSTIISECRTTLRLFDDIPMLCYSLSYGLGKKEPDSYMRLCGVIMNILDQLYYPFEHVAWAADAGLIKLRSNGWWTASNLCWALSLYFSIVRSLRYMSILQDHNKHLDLKDAVMREEFKKNSRLQLMELMSGIRCACDLIHAVHWMPEGFLWSGKLKQWHIGALGTISSILSLLQTCAVKQT